MDKAAPTVDYAEVMDTSGGEKGVASLTNLIVSRSSDASTKPYRILV